MQALFNHFKDIMGTEVERTRSINLEALGVTPRDLAHLEEDFSEDELWE